MKITTEGLPKEGKTTLAFMIAGLLREHGIETHVTWLDGTPPRFDDDAALLRSQTLRERGTRVEIIEVQPRVDPKRTAP